MFEDLKTNIASVLSNNGIDVYNEYLDVDLFKKYNQNAGFLSVKNVEKINACKNKLDMKSFEVFVTFECKVIAKKGMSAELFTQDMNDLYEDFLFSDDLTAVSINMDNLKINNLYSRLESNLNLKFRYFLTEVT